MRWLRTPAAIIIIIITDHLLVMCLLTAISSLRHNDVRTPLTLMKILTTLFIGKTVILIILPLLSLYLVRRGVLSAVLIRSVLIIFLILFRTVPLSVPMTVLHILMVAPVPLGNLTIVNTLVNITLLRQEHLPQ